MAKRGRKPGQQSGNGETVSGYFRRIFKERPELLGASSNDELLSRWLKDHPGNKEVPKNVKNNLANLKSVLRKKGRKRRGRKPAEQAAVSTGQAAASVANVIGRRLESLEERIDEGLTMARNLDPSTLANVIQLLRRARNEVVWKIGQ